MKHRFLKLGLCFFMVLNMIIPFLSPLSANEDYLIVDDTVVSNTEENYFTYSAGTDENGVVGWSSSDANYGSDELKTQHWVLFSELI